LTEGNPLFTHDLVCALGTSGDRDLEQLVTLYQERGQRTREGETHFQIGFAHY